MLLVSGEKGKWGQCVKLRAAGREATAYPCSAGALDAGGSLPSVELGGALRYLLCGARGKISVGGNGTPLHREKLSQSLRIDLP